MNLAVHWLVVDKTGAELDLIEAELHDIADAEVDRSDTPCKTGNYNAHFKVRGNFHAQELADMCDYMNEIKAYPV